MFQTTPQNITQHRKAPAAEAEADSGATCKEHLHVRSEGTRTERRQLLHYALPAVYVPSVEDTARVFQVAQNKLHFVVPAPCQTSLSAPTWCPAVRCTSMAGCAVATEGHATHHSAAPESARQRSIRPRMARACFAEGRFFQPEIAMR